MKEVKEKIQFGGLGRRESIDGLIDGELWWEDTCSSSLGQAIVTPIRGRWGPVKARPALNKGLLRMACEYP